MDFQQKQEVTKLNLSITRAIVSLFIYLFVMIVGAIIMGLIFKDNPKYMQEYSETDSIISALHTKNGIAIVEKDEFYISFYEKPNVDIYELYNEVIDENQENTSDNTSIVGLNVIETENEFLKNYLLITSIDVFTELEAGDITIGFIQTIFQEKEYFKDGYRVYRIVPKSLIENENKTNELLDYYQLDQFVFDLQSQEAKGLNSLGNSLTNFILYVVLIIGLITVMYNVIKVDFSRLGSFAETMKAALMGMLFVYLANIAANMLTIIVSALFKERIIESANQMAIVEILSGPYAPLMIIAVVLLGPIVEELVFRKAVFSFFKNKKLAIAVSSLAFGLIHVLSETSVQSFLINLIGYVTPGIVLGYIYVKNDENVVVPTITHILLNALSVILVYFL